MRIMDIPKKNRRIFFLFPIPRIRKRDYNSGINLRNKRKVLNMCNVCSSPETMAKVGVAIGRIPDYCPYCGRGVRVETSRIAQKIYFVPDCITSDDCYTETAVFHSKENITASDSLLHDNLDIVENAEEGDYVNVYEATVVGRVNIKRAVTLTADFG